MRESNFILNRDTLPIIEQMAEQLPGGFVLYRENKTRDILFVNQPLLDIYECETLEQFRELTGYTFNGMVHPEDLDKAQASIDAQIAGTYGVYDHVEYRITTRRGSVRWIDDYGHFGYSDDFGDIFYVFLFDITDRVLAQKAQSHFFSDMSHHLLTPLNAVSTFIRLAIKHQAEPELLSKYLQDAEKASVCMQEQIDRMVGTRRMPAGWIPADAAKRPVAQRVLIAEDNELNQMLLQTILEEAGLAVEVVNDGDKAVEAVQSHPAGYYDVVLMDIRMNAMDGHEATRLIRTIPGAEAETLPILALSANSRDEDVEESLRSGMNVHLAKPYNPEQIIGAINRYTGRVAEGEEEKKGAVPPDGEL